MSHCILTWFERVVGNVATQVGSKKTPPDVPAEIDSPAISRGVRTRYLKSYLVQCLRQLPFFITRIPRERALFKTRMGKAEAVEALLSRLPPPVTARPRLMSREETTACSLGCRRCWWWWALSSTPRLWSFFQFRFTSAESEQFGDVRACVSKQQLQHASGNESRGRSRMGLQNPLGGETNKQGMYLPWIDGPNKKSVTEKRVN